ncbi:hypothetical protein PR048_021036 [Dryococelus australis]|uniref:Syntaxin-18 n=1 Tax=Dryococelus australis TaxID=614101 RepID=A0ABQ9GX73_9NEOP|nr:hypothetical protein PR048_021036 [Dryococelus australis]
MSDVERDKIDSGAQRIMNTCSHLIKEFKKERDKLVEPPQLKGHHKAVIDLVECYLKAVCKIYSEQRAIRVKRAVELQKLSKLEISDRRTEKGIASSARLRRTSNENKENEDPEGNVTKEDSKKLNESNVDSNFSHYLSEDEQLSAEEMQMFESENAHLYNELNSLSDEVKQIESKVVRIAELQEIFTEKVLEQEVDVDRISMTVIGSTENVKDANEQLRQAIQRNAGLRAWVLFFLLVMSFTLLFLDWYND